jgi:hypothetical protein
MKKLMTFIFLASFSAVPRIGSSWSVIFLLETLAGYIELIKSLQNFRYVNDKLATLQLVRDETIRYSPCSVLPASSDNVAVGVTNS